MVNLIVRRCMQGSELLNINLYIRKQLIYTCFMDHKKLNLLTIISLLIASVLVQSYFINPLVLSDPMEYFKAAVLFPELKENPSH
jgi:hypothetical protein